MRFKKQFSTFLLVFTLALHLFSQENSHVELKTRLERHVAVLASDSLDGRGLGTDGKIRAQNYISAQFREAGLLPYDNEGFFQHFEFRMGVIRVSGSNVVGWLKGTDPVMSGEFIVIGAHYDHLGYELKDNKKVIYHGADDNASGVASVIELAGYFTANPQLVKRSILFVAFDAEESGLLGAKVFLEEDTIFNKSDIRVMFSMDMVGMYTDNKGLDLEGIGTLTDGEKLAKSVAEKHSIPLKNTSGDIASGTDTSPFGDKGIPAIHVYTGQNSPYHKPEDTFEKIDYEGMAGIVIFMQSLVTEMIAIPELIPSRQITKSQKSMALRFNAGITAGLGSSRHKYPDEFYNAKSVFAFNAGLFMQMHIGKWITLQPGVLYQNDGSQSDAGIFRCQSICVPVNLHFNMVNEYGGWFKVYPLAGAYYKYTFNGIDGGNELDLDKDYNNREWGMNLGMGMDIRKLQFQLAWRRGLTDISRDNENGLRSSAWFFSVGYKLKY